MECPGNQDVAFLLGDLKMGGRRRLLASLWACFKEEGTPGVVKRGLPTTIQGQSIPKVIFLT